ncbi:unnamed protein product [Urochloa decumbens]|uniref:[RNA-polymerase]-subunit kinase n=1 Tax=Urochloa decumbens TaxID=240449 RepID=A0ABC9APJ8_9POAL
MKIFARNPLQSLIHTRCVQSSGRALNVFLGHLCPKCSKRHEGTTSGSHTTGCTCLPWLFTPSSNDSASVPSVNVGNTEVLTAQPQENGFDPSYQFNNADMSVSAVGHHRKSSMHHRLKIWISSGHNGIMGRYGNKLELGVPNVAKPLSDERIDPGWPDWLTNVAPKAVQGWSPRRLDSFEKLGKVGQGTYSSVYKARDLKTGKIVALKKVRFAIVDPESVRFMAREILVLRKLNHPNVVKLEGIITSSVSRSLFLVFGYMEHDLAGLVATPGLKFTEPQVKCLLQQLLSGLDHCHRNGVLHRDMKSSNLLIDSNGVLKIADFGLATTFDPDNQQSLTSRVATLWYRPPELLLGATKYGPSVDMWSTGCILAELLAGKPILPGRTEVEQLHKIFKLCGSPSDKYWDKLEVPQTGMFKPGSQYKGCIAETFKDFPPSSLILLDSLLALEPEARGTAATTLQSDFFRTSPLACSPSSLPKCPPSKEYDARLRREEDRRQRKARQGESLNPNLIHADDGYSKLKMHEGTAIGMNIASLNSEDQTSIFTAGVQSQGFDSTWKVPGSVDTKNYKGKSKRYQHSGSMITEKGNMARMLREHEKNIQEAVRKARIYKSKEL